jgi:hypothetical protein
MTMKIIIALLIALLILVPLTYFGLISLNNLFWGYKGSPVDKSTPEYLKRKRTLQIVSVPVALFIIYVMGISLSASV